MANPARKSGPMFNKLVSHYMAAAMVPAGFGLDHAVLTIKRLVTDGPAMATKARADAELAIQAVLTSSDWKSHIAIADSDDDYTVREKISWFLVDAIEKRNKEIMSFDRDGKRSP